MIKAKEETIAKGKAALKMVRSGKTVPDTAKEMGVSKTTVMHYLKVATGKDNISVREIRKKYADRKAAKKTAEKAEQIAPEPLKMEPIKALDLNDFLTNYEESLKNIKNGIDIVTKQLKLQDN